MLIRLFFTLSFILMTNTHANNVDLNYKVNCGNVDKLELLIEKGIVTENLCLKVDDNKLSLILKNTSYALSQYMIETNDPLYQFYSTNSSKPTFQCSGNESQTANYKNLISISGLEKMKNKIDYRNSIATEKFPVEELNKFKQFLFNFKKRVNNLKENANAKGGWGEVTLQSYGYADGVRNTDDDYDLYILKKLKDLDSSTVGSVSNLTDPPNLKYLLKYNIPNFSGSSTDFSNAICNYSNFSQNDSTKLVSKIRNVFLAKMRADNLKNKVISAISGSNGINASEIKTKNSMAEISDDLLNPSFKTNCSGFCNQRRGAKIEIEIPSLVDHLTQSEVKYNEITPFYFSPYSKDQLLMNKFAMRDFALDFQDFLNSDLSEFSDEEKAFINEEKRSLLRRKSVSGETQVAEESVSEKIIIKPRVVDFDCGVAESCPDRDAGFTKFKHHYYDRIVRFSLKGMTALKVKKNTKHPSYHNAVASINNGIKFKANAFNDGVDYFVTWAEQTNLKPLLYSTFSQYFSIKESLRKLNKNINSLDTEIRELQAVNGSDTFDNITGKVAILIYGNDPTIYQASFYSELQEYLSSPTISYKLSSISSSAFSYSRLQQYQSDLGEDYNLKVKGAVTEIFERYKCFKIKKLNQGQDSEAISICQKYFEDPDFMSEVTNIDVKSLPYSLENEKFVLADLFYYASKPLVYPVRGNEVDFDPYKNNGNSDNKFITGQNDFILNSFKEYNTDMWSQENSAKNANSLTSFFIRKKFNIENPNVKIKNQFLANGEKEVNFYEHFDQIIRWSEKALEDTIESIDGGEGSLSFNLKQIDNLNFNSLTFNSESEVFYPLVLPPNNVLNTLFTHHLRVEYTHRFANDLADNFRDHFHYQSYGNSNQKEETSKVVISLEQMNDLNQGFINQNKYNELKSFFESNVDEIIKLKPWPSSDKVDQVDFIARNFSSIVKILQLQLLKEHELEDTGGSWSTKNFDQLMALSYFENIPHNETKKRIKVLYETAAEFYKFHRYTFSIESGLDANGLASYKDIAGRFGSEGLQASKYGGQVSTVFSFMDYTSALADMLNYISNNTSELTSTWEKAKYFDLMMKPVPVYTKYVYFRPDTISLQEDDTDNTVIHGFYHTACKTGVLFPHKESNKEFYYQTRYAFPRQISSSSRYYQDYPAQNDNGRYKDPYDDTYYLPRINNINMEKLNLVKIKRPMAHIIPNCKACGCLKTGQLTRESLKSLIDNSLTLDFSDNYVWVNENGKKRPLKKYDITSTINNLEEGIYGVPEQGKYTIEEVNAQNFQEQFSQYCMFAPVVPQSHEVGNGEGEQEDNGISLNKAIYLTQSCPFVDALDGVEVDELERSLGIQAIASMPNVYDKNNSDDFQKIKDIKDSCQQALATFPMDKTLCEDQDENGQSLGLMNDNKTKEIYNACNFFPDNIKQTFANNCYIKSNQKFPYVEFSAPVVVNGNVVGTYNGTMCNAITKVFDDQGRIINLHGNELVNKNIQLNQAGQSYVNSLND